MLILVLVLVLASLVLVLVLVLVGLVLVLVLACPVLVNINDRMCVGGGPKHLGTLVLRPFGTGTWPLEIHPPHVFPL